jgi:hypothetical protein
VDVKTNTKVGLGPLDNSGSISGSAAADAYILLQQAGSRRHVCDMQCALLLPCMWQVLEIAQEANGRLSIMYTAAQPPPTAAAAGSSDAPRIEDPPLPAVLLVDALVLAAGGFAANKQMLQVRGACCRCERAHCPGFQSPCKTQQPGKLHAATHAAMQRSPCYTTAAGLRCELIFMLLLLPCVGCCCCCCWCLCRSTVQRQLTCQPPTGRGLLVTGYSWAQAWALHLLAWSMCRWVWACQGGVVLRDGGWEAVWREIAERARVIVRGQQGRGCAWARAVACTPATLVQHTSRRCWCCHVFPPHRSTRLALLTQQTPWQEQR